MKLHSCKIIKQNWNISSRTKYGLTLLSKCRDFFKTGLAQRLLIQHIQILGRYVHQGVSSRRYWTLHPIYLYLIFAILQFEISSLMNLNFTGYSSQKNPVQNRKKSSSSYSIVITGELQKSSPDRQGVIIFQSGSKFLTGRNK